MSFKPIIQLTGHQSAIYSLIDINDDVFYSCGGDGYLVSWSKNGRNPDGKLIAKWDEAIFCGSYDKAQNRLAVATITGRVSILEIDTESVLFSAILHKGAIYDLKILGNYCISAGADGCLIWYDLVHKEIQLRLQVCPFALRTMDFDNEGNVYVGSSDGFIYIIDLKKQQVTERVHCHSLSVFALKIINGAIHSGGRDAKWFIHDVISHNQLLKVDAHLSTINSICAWDDLIITGSKDKSMKIWTMEGKLVQSIYASHGGHIRSVNKIITLDNNEKFASCSDDRSIIIFGME